MSLAILAYMIGFAPLSTLGSGEIEHRYARDQLSNFYYLKGWSEWFKYRNELI